jgi:hypothetical protein
MKFAILSLFFSSPHFLASPLIIRDLWPEARKCNEPARKRFHVARRHPIVAKSDEGQAAKRRARIWVAKVLECAGGDGAFGGGASTGKAACRPIPFPWHQIQRTDIRFQGKTGTVLLRPRGTLTGEISLCFHLKCGKSVPLVPRKARAKEPGDSVDFCTKATVSGVLPVGPEEDPSRKRLPHPGTPRASCPSGWWAERAGRWSQRPMADRTPDRLEARSYDGRLAQYRFLGTRFNGQISVFRARPGRSCYGPEGHSQAKSPCVSI